MSSIDVKKKKILNIEIMEKQETDNKSSQMEILGVKRNLVELVKHAHVSSVTIDKNSTIP